MPPSRRLAAPLLAVVLAAGCGGGGPAGTGGAGGAGGGAHDPPPVSLGPGNGVAALVDPFIGTGDSDVPSPVANGKGGATFPGAALPFGMVQWSPDTPHAEPAGYHFGDDQITGFSLTHLSGAGCSAKRDFPILPVVGAWDPAEEPLALFDHAREIASPGFYHVFLASGIIVDLTATTRAGLARFTFPTAPEARVVLSGGWHADALLAPKFTATIHPDGTITGHRTDAFFCATSERYEVYFAARFDRPFASSGTWSDGAADSGSTVSGTKSGVFVTFDATDRQVVQMKVGISYVSEAGALANLDGEIPGWDFDAVHAAAIDRWDQMLGRVAVEGGADEDRRAFYTSLYHTLLQPGVASDLDGSFMGMDGQPKKAPAGHARYADFSGWDVYRSWVQLASVIAPAETSDMMRSLVDAGAECGALPKWSLESTETGVMVGDPADATLASARAFGAGDFDAQAALALMVKGATDPAAKCNAHVARPGLADYLARGYCPADAPGAPAGAAAVTLEYAIADFAIARLAEALGDGATAADMSARGLSYQNVFDKGLGANGFTGYMAPRLAQDQNGMPAFQAIDVGKNQGFVEGNATQYTLIVPHDVRGLASLLGGDAMLVARLDALFTEVNAGLDQPYFYIGNEPGFATPWAYAFAGAPWRTQDVVRRILAEGFAVTPGGLPGNDDLGATSSWQVWAMLGLYPAIPGVGGFVLGSPRFPKVTIQLAGGKALVITAAGADAKSPYVQSLLVNGAPSTSTWLPWDVVSAGATLDFTLGAAPNMAWGAAAADRPPSFYP